MFMSERDYFKHYLPVIEAYSRGEVIQLQDINGLWHDILQDINGLWHDIGQIGRCKAGSGLWYDIGSDTLAIIMSNTQNKIRIKPKKTFIPWTENTAPNGPIIVVEKNKKNHVPNMYIAKKLGNGLWIIKNPRHHPETYTPEYLLDNFLQVTSDDKYLPCGTEQL